MLKNEKQILILKPNNVVHGDNQDVTNICMLKNLDFTRFNYKLLFCHGIGYNKIFDPKPSGLELQILIDINPGTGDQIYPN